MTDPGNEKCPVCQSGATTLVVRRTGVPVHQNLVVGNQAAACATPRGDIHFMVCKECGFGFNSTFDPSKLSYNSAYDNTQSCSGYFASYMDELVRYLVIERSVRNCRIVEVGCGKGLFLRKLVEYKDGGNVGVGFDPTYVGPDVDLDGRLRFERRFYGPECAGTAADVVICRHVIEHVPQPVDLLASVARALAGRPNARVFFETPCLQWILQNKVIWDLFYEHCSLFTKESLSTAFGLAGLNVTDVRHVFGGQYLWIEATIGAAAKTVIRDSDGMARMAEQYAMVHGTIRASITAQLEQLNEHGKVGLWGAGAKGATLANLVDPQRQLIECLIDLNPAKQGNFVAGTGHPIIKYQELPHYGVKSVILMNPNYRAEIEASLKGLTADVKLVDLQMRCGGLSANNH